MSRAQSRPLIRAVKAKTRYGKNIWRSMPGKFLVRRHTQQDTHTSRYMFSSGFSPSLVAWSMKCIAPSVSLALEHASIAAESISMSATSPAS